LSHLKKPSKRIDITSHKFGVLIGGSGLIGGALMHYFKKKTSDNIEILSPNSKKLSLREPKDIKQYFHKYRPDFIINSAISAIDGNAQLTYETNYLGSINLAKVAMALKIPPFIHYLLENREEFSGQKYHFVDHNPVELSQVILTIKSYLKINIPKEIYISYPMARFSINCLKLILKGLNRIGIEARLPPEMMFMKSFYKTLTLSTEKLRNSSYGIPDREHTVFTGLSSIIEYYITRWEHLNLISSLQRLFLRSAETDRTIFTGSGKVTYSNSQRSN